MVQRSSEEIAHELAVQTDCDLLLYNGPIVHPLDRAVMNLRRRHECRPNVMLILVTYGGDADCAYRIAKCLQAKYTRFTLFVTGYCKSAGTLVALGAHELVFADGGELGPLDVQMSKADSLWEAQSSLAIYDAITALQDKAYLAFERFFLQMENRSEGAITVRTAAEIASRLAIGLFRPLYAHIDPIHVGEAARALQVADRYGQRLVQNGRNFDPASLDGLITSYPSHGFVIDKQEAERVFYNVRTALDLEAELVDALGAVAVSPGDTPIVRYLSRSPASAGITDAVNDAYPWSEEHDESPDLRTDHAAARPASPGGPDALA